MMMGFCGGWIRGGGCVERDGGVYVQSEVVSLTRDIPTGVAWLVKPFVTSIPQESLEFTMEATRKAVEGERMTGLYGDWEVGVGWRS